MKSLIAEYDEHWIKEYPQVDREYMETYPLTFAPADSAPAFEPRNLHLYIHVPFCATSCHFCTFLHFDRTNSNVAAYLPNLLREIDLWFEQRLFHNYRVRSIFFGGGTATSFSPDQIGAVLQRIRQCIDVADDAEITVESHPNTVNERALNQLRSLGVNRMTYGIQSFNDEQLGLMELTQRSARNHSILRLSREAGFPSVCMDLMFALPGQRLSSLKQDLEAFFEHDLDGISCYRYVIDPENTLSPDKRRFFLASVPSEEEANEMYAYLVQGLLEGGLVQYTQPDFAKADKVCVYTQAVWKAPQEEQLGLGVGALSYNVNNYSFVNTHNLHDYEAALAMGRLPTLLSTPITPDELMRKYFVLGIKCIEVDTVKFEERFGIPWQILFHEPVRLLERLGMVSYDGRYLRLTDKGKLYVDYVCKQFYSYRNRGKHQPDGLLFAQMKISTSHIDSPPSTTFIPEKYIDVARAGGEL